MLPCAQLHIEGIVSGISLATVKLCKKPMQRVPRYLRLSRDEADAAAGSVCVPVVLTADGEEGSLFPPGEKKRRILAMRHMDGHAYSSRSLFGAS